MGLRRRSPAGRSFPGWRRSWRPARWSCRCPAAAASRSSRSHRAGIPCSNGSARRIAGTLRCRTAGTGTAAPRSAPGPGPRGVQQLLRVQFHVMDHIESTAEPVADVEEAIEPGSLRESLQQGGFVLLGIPRPMIGAVGGSWPGRRTAGWPPPRRPPDPASARGTSPTTRACGASGSGKDRGASPGIPPSSGRAFPGIQDSGCLATVLIKSQEIDAFHSRVRQLYAMQGMVGKA